MNKLSNLQAENDVLRREAAEHEATIAEAALAIGDLVAKLEAAKRQIDELERIAKVGKYAPKPRPARVVTQDELDRVERMAVAKAQAMATKATVLA